MCVEKNTAKVFSNTEGWPNAQAQTVAEDAQGAIWISFGQRQSIARIQNGRVTTFGGNDGIPGGGTAAIAAIAADNTGQLWLVKDGAVTVFRDEQFRTVARLSDAGSVSIAPAKTGGIWICAGPHLSKYTDAGGLEAQGQLPDGAAATALLEDHAGALWIGTAANGLFLRTGSGLQAMPTSHGQIACLLEDHEGNIWAGTSGGGLNRLRPRAVELLGTKEGLPFESVRSVCEDSTGTVWATTQNGLLARQAGTGWEVVPLETNWPGVRVNCVTSDANGAVWIGTVESGLLRFQNGQFTNWPTRTGPIHGLLVSSNGDLWIAYSSRVQRMRGNTLKNISLPTAAHYVRAMAEDISGNIWVGTSDGQLFRIRDTNAVDWTARMRGGATSIRCLYCTPDGALWIGYAGSGLGRFKEDEYCRLTTRQGLHNDYISQIVADNAGRLWLAGNGGIFQVSLDELSDFADGTIDRVRSVVYGRAEGLPSLQATYDMVPGATRGRDGRIWMSMQTGLAVVHPEGIRGNPEPPPVLITKVTVDDQPVAEYDSRSPLREPETRGLADLREHSPSLELGAHYRKLKIDFTALSFIAPENVNFRYRVEPFEDTWNEGGVERSSSPYAHLNPGNYRFHVIACNNSGVWNEKGAMIAFTVAPFFWQRWWFRLAMLGTFTLCIVAIVRYVSFRRLRRHVEQLERQTMLHKERARIAKDIHDDLGANLTQITLLSELARQDMTTPEKAGGHVDKISSTARQVMKSLDEIVWAVNPRNDTLPHLVDYLGQFTLDFLRAPGIRCRLDLPEHPPALNVSADIRHNLFLAVKEALNNIVKHAGAKEVRLGVDVSNGKLRVVVRDDGHGFEQSPDNAWADGLRNMQQRMGEIGGACAIESHAGQGTTIIFDVPWRN